MSQLAAAPALPIVTVRVAEHECGAPMLVLVVPGSRLGADVDVRPEGAFRCLDAASEHEGAEVHDLYRLDL